MANPSKHPGHTSSSSLLTSVSVSNSGTINMGVIPAPIYQVPPGLPHTPPTPAPPGISPSMPFAVNMSVTASSVDTSSAFPRPTMQAAPLISNNPVQQLGYGQYLSMPPVAAPLQGQWLQPPQVSGMLRPPFSAYPAAFTATFALPARGVPPPFVPSPDTQPPGVTSMRPLIGTQTSPAASTSVSTTVSLQPEMPPGTEDNRKADDKDAKNDSSTGNALEAWTAHRTETGAVYYYNALTGESTYEKPAGFKEEVEKLTGQTTPVSWEKLAGTDWVWVTTNDSKRYYYNTKTKMSSWQIPSEVIELKKKHEADTLESESMSVTNNNVSAEKGSGSIPLSAPAVVTGGRDATALRPSPMAGQSSALDLIKKKLQDPGAPVVLPAATLFGSVSSELNGSQVLEETVSGVQDESSKDKPKDAHGDNNVSDSSSDSEDDTNRPTKQESVLQFKEMLKERGVAPFSKWEKELPKIVFDPRFKAIPSHSARRALFDHYVKTRAEEERKEKRAAQKAAIEGFKKLLEEAKEDIDHNSSYEAFKKKWGNDPRFLALERRERETLLNERILRLKRAAEEKAQAERATAINYFKSMLRENGNITPNTRWSRVKDSVRNDPRYKSVKHDEREVLFNEYVSELKAEEEGADRALKDKYDEEEKLKERERVLRKRKEREEQEVERVRVKAQRKEAVESYQALLVETVKDAQATWTESKPKLEKDAQGRATNPSLDHSDLEKLFREHVKILQERCASEFRTLLAEVITADAAVAQEKEDGKTALTSWSTAKQLLKADPRYMKMPRKDRESYWRRHVDDIQRRQMLSHEDRETRKDANKRSSMENWGANSRRNQEKRETFGGHS